MHALLAVTGGCLAGAQKELHQWPVFQALLDIMPGCSIHIHFISPNMEEDMDGSRKQISVQQGNSNSTSWLYADTTRAVDEAGSSSSAAATNDSVLQPVIPPESTQKEFCSAAGGTSYGDTAPQMVDKMQQAASIPCGQAAMQADMTKSTDKVPTLQLTFHKGLYHDVMAGPCCESASADLVFGANAGEHLPTLIDRVAYVWSCCWPCAML